MNFFDNLNFKQVNVLKLAGLGLVVMIVLAFIIRVFGASFSSLPMFNRLGASQMGVTPYGYQAMDGYGGGGVASAPGMAELSARNIAPMPPTSPNSVGGDAEAFEATRYYGTIETRHLKDTCAKIVELKGRDYVVFENANESDQRCNYSFKVEREHVQEVLARVKELQPKDLSENIQTIKRQLDDFTSEKEILEKKLVSIEKTLEDAIRSYEEIAVIATRSQDASSLAKIIESKLQIIERLTNERIAINTQLDRLERAKTEQLDQVSYTYFTLNVFENKFIDVQDLKDSWKEAVKGFVGDINRVLQDITINLVALLFFAAQYVLYFFVLLIVVKYVWLAAKNIWKK